MMKTDNITNIHNGFKDFFLSEKASGLILAIKELAALLGEDEGVLAGRFIGAIGHEFEAEVTNRIIKEFHLKLGPGYRFIPEKAPTPSPTINY